MDDPVRIIRRTIYFQPKDFWKSMLLLCIKTTVLTTFMAIILFPKIVCDIFIKMQFLSMNISHEYFNILSALTEKIMSKILTTFSNVILRYVDLLRHVLPRSFILEAPWYYERTQSSGGSRISPRRGRQLPGGGGGRQHTNLSNFPKNCMKSKEFGPPGDARPP